MEIFAVGVEEGGEAADKCSSDLIGAESGWAHEADCRDTASVDSACAGWRLLVCGRYNRIMIDLQLHLNDSSSHRSSQTAHIDLPSLFRRMKQ